MNYISRDIEKQIHVAKKHFSAVLLTGPRRSGKTTLLKELLPHASYYLLEDPDIIARVRSDPRSFVEELKCPVILDEIQNVPELLSYLRTRIDAKPHTYGQYFITGSQDFSLMRHVSESMAGRAAIIHLLPFSRNESKKVTLLHGGFPEVIRRPHVRALWFRSYIQTYLERDVRLVSPIKDLVLFRKFLSLLASRTGKMVNKTDIAAPLGVSVPTVTEWLHILEVTGHIILVPPYYENFGKRIVKTPKVYFVDSGLCAFLLGIESEKMMRHSLFYGSLFEGFVAAEIVKYQLNNGKQKELYFFRDQQGLEVDFLIPQGSGKVLLMEVKTSRTITPSMAHPMKKLSCAMGHDASQQYVVRVPQNKNKKITVSALVPGVKIIGADEMAKIL